MQIMGILNLTPDSFYDGGRYGSVESACRRAEEMVQEGADILDLGGESTRPGSQPVSAEEELSRVLPVVKKISKRYPRVPISVDTQKSEVARQSLQEGASIINDISALRSDPGMADVLRQYRAQVLLMHMRGSPRTMQQSPRYKNVVREVKSFLSQRVRWAVEQGISESRIWIDPGIGFGKTLRHNLGILRDLKSFLSLKLPLVVGCSRKSFIGGILGEKKFPLPAEERLEGSLAAACWSYWQGVSILRVHDVGSTKKMIQVLSAVQGY
ncbi:MAG: dihydropteroate synthase [Elusimicrobia bacterium]|nr:dihydropteroate synthase [Elusimicrobiota bacterium]